MSDVQEGEVSSQALCAQHPEREAVRTCTRCGRYACSWCERAEGQCRDCARLAVLAVPDSRARARRAARFFQVAAVMDLLTLVSHGIWFGGGGGEAEPLLDSAATVVVVLSLVISVVAQVGLLMWFHRLVRQLKVQGEDMGVTPAMAVWWWLIPIANWVKPYQLMKDAAERLGGMHFAAALPLNIWWGANILARLLDQVSRRLLNADSANAAEASSVHVLGILGALCGVAMALFCVQIIRALQEQLDRRRAGYEAVEGAPAPEGDMAEAA
jgi:hypothetical protein